MTEYQAVTLTDLLLAFAATVAEAHENSQGEWFVTVSQDDVLYTLKDVLTWMNNHGHLGGTGLLVEALT